MCVGLSLGRVADAQEVRGCSWRDLAIKHALGYRQRIASERGHVEVLEPLGAHEMDKRTLTMQRSISIAIVSGFIAVATSFVGAPAALADDPTDGVFTVARQVPAASVQTWIDLEKPGLASGDVSVDVTSSAGSSAVTWNTTVFGLSAVVDVGPGPLTVTLTANADLDAHFAVTTVDSNGVIVDAWDQHIALTAGGGEPGPGPSPTPTPTPSPSPGGGSIVIPGGPSASPTQSAHTSQAGAEAGTGGGAAASTTATSLLVILMVGCGGALVVAANKRGSKQASKASRAVMIMVVGMGLMATMVGVTAPPGHADPLTPVANDAGLSSSYRVPSVESQAGVGARLGVQPGSMVALPGIPQSCDGALVRIAVLNAGQDTDVFVTGAPALSVGADRSASTTVLVPVTGGSIPVYASAPADVRIDVLATFRSDPAAPGAVMTLPTVATRADTDGQALAGQGIGSEPITVGLVGQGGVPSTGVRAVFVTATVSASAAGSVTLMGQTVPVGAGRTSVTTVVVPDAQGAMSVSFAGSAGSADLRVDVRGWVSEPVQNSAKANVTGSFVPVSDVSPRSVSVGQHEELSMVPTTTGDTAYALAMVNAGPSSVVSLLDLGQGDPGRGRGAVVDPHLGALPQLTLARVVDGKVLATVRDAAVAANVEWLGGFLGAAAPSGRPMVEITSPVDGATISLADSQGLTMTGTVSGGVAMESVTIVVDGQTIGSAALTYSASGIEWSFVGLAPIGRHSVTVTAADRAGTIGTGAVSFTIPELLPTDVIVSPETVVLPAVQDGVDLVGSITDDTVTLNAEPAFVPGAVIVSDTVPGAPQGFLRRVVSIDQVGDQWVVHTSPASLVDAIWWCDEEDTVDLFSAGEPVIEDPGPTPGFITIDDGVPNFEILPSDVANMDPYPNQPSEPEVPMSGTVPTNEPTSTPGIEPMAGGIMPMSFGLDQTVSETFKASIDLNLPLSGPPVDSSRGSDDAKSKSAYEVKVTGGVTLSATVQLSFALHFVVKISVEFNWGLPKVVVDDFTVKLTQTSKIETTFGLFLKDEWKTSAKEPLATIRPATLTFSIAFVPVVITTTIKTTLDTEASVSAKISVTIGERVQRKQEYGFSYSTKQGLKNLKSSEASYDNPPEPKKVLDEEFDADYDASVGVTASLSVSLYDAFGPVFSMGLSAMLEGNLNMKLDMASGTPSVTASGRFGIYLGAELSGKVELKVPIIDEVLLSATLLSWKAKWALGELCWESLTGWGKCDPFPTPSPSPSPSPTKTTTVSGSPTPSASPTGESNLVPDPLLRQCIADEMFSAGIGGPIGDPGWARGDPPPAAITLQDMDALAATWSYQGGIDCWGIDIRSLEGIQFFGNKIFYLSVVGTRITDLSPLSNLTNLRTLHLYENQISDLSGVENLQLLTYLDLCFNQLSDITALSKLSSLRYLNLCNNQISTISPLETLLNLETLYMSSNQIADLTPLKNMKKLARLELNVNKISNLGPLSGLSQLEELSLNNNQVSDLHPLGSLSHLRTLYLGLNRISDTSGLEPLASLSSLDLWANQIVDVSPLGSLTRLTGLELNDNEVVDISPLAALSLMEVLNLWGNNISDVTPILAMTRLRWCELDDNNIADVSPLLSFFPQSRFPFACYVKGQNISTVSTVGVHSLPAIKPSGVSWVVQQGDATINDDGTITYRAPGIVTLAWDIQDLWIFGFTGTVTVDVT